MYRMAVTGCIGPRSKDEGPLLVAVILDPFNGSAMQAALTCQQELKHPSGSSTRETPCDVRAMCFAGDSTEEEALRGLMTESVSTAWFHNNLRIDGHKRRVSNVATTSTIEATFATPSFQCAALDREGRFVVPALALQEFLDHPSTEAEARSMVQRLTTRCLAADSPKLKLAPEPQVAAEIAANLPARAPVHNVTFPAPPTLEALLQMSVRADVPSKDGKVRVIVLADGRAFAVVNSPVSVAQGAFFLGCGSVGDATATEAAKKEAEGFNVWQAVLADDTTDVIFEHQAVVSSNSSTNKAAPMSTPTTVYGMLGMLTVQGKSGVSIQRHTVSQAEPFIMDGVERCLLFGRGLGDRGGWVCLSLSFHIDMYFQFRYKITSVEPKATWVCKRKRAAQSDSTELNKTSIGQMSVRTSA